MRLDLLVERSLRGSGLLVEVRSGATGAETEVTDLTMDSRSVPAGSMFACVPGSGADGHDFAAHAIRAGAASLLVERPLPHEVPQVVVTSARRALGHLAATVHEDPSRAMTVVGVTGTNGKTTTTALLAAVLDTPERPARTVGTLTQARTTPEAPDLQRRLAELRAEGVGAVAMEVSSHALDQHRVDGVAFAAGVLTNLTQDHLDYHGTMERYFEAKALLFEPGRCTHHVVNRDDAWGVRLVDRLTGRGQEVATFGMSDARDLTLATDGSVFSWEGTRVRIALGGRFNVLNALAAARTAQVLGLPRGDIAEGLGRLRSVPGRFERVEGGEGADDLTVLVDYAHTPDGLRHALSAARELTRGRLLVVFGAGGDRDRSKRPLMGAVAAELADLVVVTSDNPRSEDPGAIIDEVVAGAGDADKVQRVQDRADAIETAILVAGPGDVVLVAGKGHETGQEAAGQVRPFDDAAVARGALERRVANRGGRR